MNNCVNILGISFSRLTLKDTVNLIDSKVKECRRPSSNILIENDTARYNKISKTIRSYGFRDLQVKLYHPKRVFNSLGYISLLNTYSDHRSMAEPTKQLLYNEIENAILENMVML